MDIATIDLDTLASVFRDKIIAEELDEMVDTFWTMLSRQGGDYIV